MTEKTKSQFMAEIRMLDEKRMRAKKCGKLPSARIYAENISKLQTEMEAAPE